jgi:protein SCO1/2
VSARLRLPCLLVCAALLATPAAGAAGPDEHAGHAAHRELAGDEPARGRSLYPVAGSGWIDQDGQPFAFASLRGSPVLLVLFYGTCDSVCPIVVRDAKKVEALLPEADRRRTRFVLVTIDPQVDTPERLRAYARDHELDPARWTLLHGAPEKVRMLANLLGVKYRPTGSGQYSHTIRITLLDREGNAVDHADGLQRPLEPIAARISSLLADAGPAPAPK